MCGDKASEFAGMWVVTVNLGCTDQTLIFVRQPAQEPHLVTAEWSVLRDGEWTCAKQSFIVKCLDVPGET